MSTDEEILERCEFLRQVTGLGARLITGDSGVRINARARGIDVYKLPFEELLPRFRSPVGDNDPRDKLKSAAAAQSAVIDDCGA